MTNFVEAVRGIVNPEHIVPQPVQLSEPAETSLCEPVLLQYSQPHWALRLKHNEHLPFLRELTTGQSVRRLTDYLVFIEPANPPKRATDVALYVLICELKSSAGGATAGRAQVELGEHLAEYLVRLAAFSVRQREIPKIWTCGLIVSHELPINMVLKGPTRPGKVELPQVTGLSGMNIYFSRDGGEVRLENIYGG